MSEDEIRRRLKEFTYWYHKIRLSPNIVTPGFDLDELWEHTRRVRNHIDYTGKRVLDIASFDGLFAFEAEQLGASLVVATDCLYRSFSNFLFCRELFGSRVVPYFNISPYNLTNRLDVFLDENYDEERPNERRFDIVQHLGLLYHLRDPMYSLSQARSLLAEGGSLLVETDVVLDTDEAFLLFNGMPNSVRVRDNYTVWWAPTRECLFEMLESTMFEVKRETYSEIYFEPPATDAGRMSTARRKTIQRGSKAYRIGRGAVVAIAKPLGSENEKFERELCRTFRNPGLDLSRLGWLSPSMNVPR